MKILYTVKLYFTFFFFLLFFTNFCTGSTQSDSTKILEQYRLKIIGATSNFFVNNSRIAIDNSLTKASLKKHINSTFKNDGNTHKLLMALVNTGTYKDSVVPHVGDYSDLVNFCNYINMSIKSKTNKKDKFNDFKKTCAKLRTECNDTLQKIDISPTEAGATSNNSNKWADFNKATIRKVQKALRSLGYYKGAIDGRMGQQGKQAVHKYLQIINAKDADILTDAQIGTLVESAKKQELQNKKPQERDIGLIWKILIFLNLLFFIILFSLFWLRRKNQKNEIEEINQKIIDSAKRLNNKLSANIDPQQGKIISTLQTRISTIERDFMLLKTKVDKQQSTRTTDGATGIDRPVERKPVYSPPRIIKKYTEYPDTPNGFQVVSLSDNETTNSRYEITLQNETSATFIFKASQNATEYAINNSQMILRNACDYNNMPNNGRKIKTEVPGRLTKEGGVWRILSKAKIRFYN